MDFISRDILIETTALANIRFRGVQGNNMALSEKYHTHVYREGQNSQSKLKKSIA
jgi:hypothetical protein